MDTAMQHSSDPTDPKYSPTSDITTIVWLDFRPDVDYLKSRTDDGKAWNATLFQISKESSWEHTILATLHQASNQRILIIGSTLVPFSPITLCIN